MAVASFMGMMVLAALTTMASSASSSFAASMAPKSRAAFGMHRFQQTQQERRTTQLHAIGVLARKAKEMDVRKYCEGGVEEDVLAQLQQIKDAMAAESETSPPTLVRDTLTKRLGTVTIVAEYRRLLSNGEDIPAAFYDSDLLGGAFREFGASCIAVLCDERVGRCEYDVLARVVQEQAAAASQVPGPLPVICSDLVVDEVQIARAAAAGAHAVCCTASLFAPEEQAARLCFFQRAAAAVGMETIVHVASAAEAQRAVQAGATILNVMGVAVEGQQEEASMIAESDEEVTALLVQAKCEALDGIATLFDKDADDETPKVCTIATVLAREDGALGEVEEAWMVRDSGKFQAVWVSDALYKGGSESTESPGAILKSMKAKSSVKWASPRARPGKGEGAKEYLGDILM